MKLILTSDTHYGFTKNTHRIHEAFLYELGQSVIANDVKVVLHAGDWGTAKQDQLKRTLLMFRRYIPQSCVIAGVRGNHDLWDYRSNPKEAKWQWDKMQEMHQQWFKAANIHHLEGNPLVVDNVIILGFDGWYKDSFPPTRDAEYMNETPEGEWVHDFHSKRAYKALTGILETNVSPYRASVCVTHHPPFASPRHASSSADENFYDPIKEKFDVFCVGHSHQLVDKVEGNCRVLNCGSHYDKPKFKLFEI